MEKHNTFNYSTDYLDVVSHAGLFTYHHAEKIVQPDDMILGIYLYTKKFEFFEVFRSFLGCKRPHFLQQVIDARYPQLAQMTQPVRLQLQLDDVFQHKQTFLKEQQITKLNFLILFETALDHMSEELTDMFVAEQVNIEHMKKRLAKAIEMTVKGEVPVLDMFSMLHHMISKLNLDISHADILIDVAKLSEDKTKS